LPKIIFEEKFDKKMLILDLAEILGFYR